MPYKSTSVRVVTAAADVLEVIKGFVLALFSQRQGGGSTRALSAPSGLQARNPPGLCLRAELGAELCVE